jgi:hypothetical protein
MQTDAQIKEAIKAAEDCKDPKQCAAAWDEVEELAAAASHSKKVCAVSESGVVFYRVRDMAEGRFVRQRERSVGVGDACSSMLNAHLSLFF